jgi:hypothetical protein
MTSPRNDALINNLSGDFQKRYEPNFAFCNAISMYQLLPSLRGFWPMSSVNESGSVFDISGQGRTLTNSAVIFNYGALAPYATFNGAAYLYRADEAGTSITGGLTLGCWINFTNAIGAEEEFLSKYLVAGNQRSFAVRRKSTGEAEFAISNNGTTTIGINSIATMTNNTWYFVVARYNPSTEIAVFLNGIKATLAVGVYASLYDGTASFAIGGRSSGSTYTTGNIIFPFLCATNLSDTIVGLVFEQTRALFGV